MSKRKGWLKKKKQKQEKTKQKKNKNKTKQRKTTKNKEEHRPHIFLKTHLVLWQLSHLCLQEALNVGQRDGRTNRHSLLTARNVIQLTHARCRDEDGVDEAAEFGLDAQLGVTNDDLDSGELLLQVDDLLQGDRAVCVRCVCVCVCVYVLCVVRFVCMYECVLMRIVTLF